LQKQQVTPQAPTIPSFGAIPSFGGMPAAGMPEMGDFAQMMNNPMMAQMMDNMI